MLFLCYTRLHDRIIKEAIWHQDTG